MAAADTKYIFSFTSSLISGEARKVVAACCRSSAREGDVQEVEGGEGAQQEEDCCRPTV